MPLFKSPTETKGNTTHKPDTRVRSSSPERKRGFFSTNRRSSAEFDQSNSKRTGGKPGTGIASSPERKRGFFSTNRRSSAEFDQSNSKRTGGKPGTGIASSPERKGGIFSSSRRTNPSSSESNHSTSKRSGGRFGTGIFGRRRNKSRSIGHDPSVISARQKVSEAEQAEKDADRALGDARHQVQLARERIHTLEQEVIEESRIAELKQAEAKVIHKAAKTLGRHGP